jgi:uncharacterized Zn-binding protein involved in type VI secretion
MGQPAAKQGDQIIATDTHIVLIPSPSGPIPTPVPYPFTGIIQGNLSANVHVMGAPAATVGTTADCVPPHIPEGGPFQRPPSNRGQVVTGSTAVMINGKPAARNGDTALTCNDPVDLPLGTVVAVGTVMMG